MQQMRSGAEVNVETFKINNGHNAQLVEDHLTDAVGLIRILVIEYISKLTDISSRGK